MSRKKVFLSAMVSLVQICVLAAIVAVAHGGAGAGATGSIAITGTVTSPNGSGAANIAVYATDPSGNTVEFGPSTTASDGTYELDVEAGTYDIHFDPASGSDFNPVVDSNVTVLNNQTINVQLTPVYHTLSGTVLDSNNNPVGGVTVTTFLNDTGAAVKTNTDSDGHYSLSLPSGSYYVDLSRSLTPSSNLPPIFSFTNDKTSPSIALTSDSTLDFHLPPTVNLTIVTKDSDGNPVGNIGVSGSSNNNSSSAKAALIPGSAAQYFVSGGLNNTTDATGTYVSPMWQNMVFNAHSISAQFPSGAVNNASPFNTFNGDMSVPLTVVALHTLSGTILDNSNNPVSGVTVTARGGPGQAITPVKASTDSNGHYSMQVPSNSYYVDLSRSLLPSSNMPPSFSFTNDNSAPSITISADATLNFQLPPVVNLTVNTNDTDGNQIGGVRVNGSNNVTSSSKAALNPTGTAQYFVSGVFNNTTDSTGTFTVPMWQNVVFNAVSAHFSNATVNSRSFNTFNGDVSITITNVVNHILAGTVLDNNNNAISGVTITARGGPGQAITPVKASTDSNGHYSMSLPSSPYYMDITRPLTSSANLPPTFTFTNDNSAPSITLSSDATLNFQLPPVVNMTILTKDSNDNPIGGIHVNGSSSNNSQSSKAALNPGGSAQYYVSSALNNTTDATGMYVTPMWQNIVFSAHTISAQYPSGTVTNANSIDTFNGDVTLIFQDSLHTQPPSAPTNLTASSPSQVPSLSWSAVVNASSYNIYRNGNKIDSSTTNSYIDNSAPEGINTYYVTAVNSGGESSQSNDVNVEVDHTSPTITYAFSSSPNSAGWNNSQVVVTFNCSDGGSGIASCSPPMTESTDGTFNLTGTATDKAGNTSSIDVTIHIDATAPTVGNTSWTTNPVQVGNNSTVTVPATDALSGVTAGEYFVGTDPGAGNGTAMTYNSSTGTISATFGSSLSPGVYTVGYRSKDTAGNWSNTGSTMLVVYDNNTSLGVTGKNKKDLIPSLANGDVLPGLTNNTQTDAADYGFTVQYKNGSLDAHNDFMFTYNPGTSCSGPHPGSSCPIFTVNANSFDWLVVNGANNSKGEFQGSATVTVNGVNTTNPFSVTGIDGNRLTPSVNNSITLNVYAPGANPQTASPIYHVSGSMTSNNSVKIQ